MLRWGAGIVLTMLLVSGLAPWLATQDPQVMNLQSQYAPPSADHWFGLDENGSDVFSKVIYGGRVSLLVALSVVFCSAGVGLLLGSLAGYSGGVVDRVVMRLTDIVYAFPGFLLALALVAMLGPALSHLILAMCLTGWASFARLIRGEVLHLKESEYIQAARALGALPHIIVVKHIWPNLLGVLLVQMTLGIAGAIVTESGLSFLGLGVPPTTPSWGSLLNSGRHFLMEAPHISLFPGLAIVLLVFGFNLLGESMRARVTHSRDL
tara:strand:+ start:968 stop:1762 length:795 start_codon:yes stop_codon:yes gene_type:complete